MIPHTIHYCWFGRNPLPQSAQRCIASWRKFLPDYKIVEWNEDNFDVNAIAYTRQAYAAGKWAFVSDYARFKILHDHGGIYFDTDVEVIAPLDDIIAAGPFMGYEVEPSGKNVGSVNPGLGLGVAPGLALYAEILDFYAGHHFLKPDGSPNLTTVVTYTTDILIKHGLQPRPGKQTVAGVTIYPKDYFNPLDDNTGRLRKTANTRTIHWYSKTWLSEPRWRRALSRWSHRLLGTRLIPAIRRHISSIMAKTHLQ
ncbi:MAG: glycosyltransferase family 32 protein [Muribaculaceae bacterium]